MMEDGFLHFNSYDFNFHLIVMWTTNIFDKNVLAHEYVIDHLHISDFDSKVIHFT